MGSWSGYERDRLFVRPEAAADPFVEAAGVEGVDFDDDGRSAVALDVDGDGDLDLAVLSLQRIRLLENTSRRRHFSRVRLRATRSEPLALGAVVELTAGGVTRRDYVKATEGFLAQVSPELHFGLGEADRVERVRVTWRSGRVQEWEGLPADRLLVLTEDAVDPRVLELPHWPAEAAARPARPVSPGTVAPLLSGSSAPLGRPGAPLVLNFWSPGCAGCAEELPALEAVARRHRDDAAFAGVCVIEGDPAPARQSASGAFPQFVATDELVRGAFEDPSKIPLPATLVFDAEGTLKRAFFRPVEEAELESLLASLKSSQAFWVDLELMGRTYLFAEKFPEARESLRRALELHPDGTRERYEYALALMGCGELDKALAEFRRVVEKDPDYNSATHFNMGGILRQQKHPAEAAVEYRKALSLQPGDVNTLLGLGSSLVESGQVEDGMKMFADALRAHPESAEGNMAMGQVLLSLGRDREAAPYLDRAKALAPASPAVRQLLDGIRR